MSRNTWIVFIAICVLLIGSLVFVSRDSRKIDLTGLDIDKALDASEASGDIADWTKGSKSPKVTIVEYADFQCPGCRSAQAVLGEVIEKYGDDVQLVYRHFPLSSMHPNARAAAAAAEAAGKQGKFWEMQDRLFVTQKEWSQASGNSRTDKFADIANELGLDRDKFIEDLTGDDISAKINFDIVLGREAGVSGTPALFVDGKQIDSWFLGDDIVPEGTEGAMQVWNDPEAIGKFVIEPKLKEAGVNLDKYK